MKNKSLMPKDYSRCSNENCSKKESCDRFLQLKIDLESKELRTISVTYFKENNCESYIEK